MRVKQTAKKITSENQLLSAAVVEVDKTIIIDNSEHNSCDNNQNEGNSDGGDDGEVEFLVECRRDNQGNQFLLDGTLVIEPAAVESEYTIGEERGERGVSSAVIEEINYKDFIKEIQTEPAQTINDFSGVSKKNLASFGPNPNTYSTVKCTACNAKLNPFLGKTMFIHPLMEVILCSNCIQNQKEEFFIIDKEDNKETLCRWCVEGGSLICCDYCPKSFCKTCIKRNLGRTTLSEILNQDDSVQWKCFICDPTPIESLKTSCKKVQNDVNLFNDKQKYQKLAKKPINKLNEVITNKKRSLSKAFPNDTLTNTPPSVTSLPKLSAPLSLSSPSHLHNQQQQQQNPIIINKKQQQQSNSTGALLSNMSNFGTDWYLKNVNLRNIFTEIDDIDSRTLLNALNSTKKCIEAFYSDIRNLEVEISKASTASDIPAVVSMFKSVYRHHIFNRFSQIKSRIEEDKKNQFVPQYSINNNNNNSNSRKSMIKNCNSIPNLTINSVVSTGVTSVANNINNNNSFVKLSNGGGDHSNHYNHNNNSSNNNNNNSSSSIVMASIDLTDEGDTEVVGEEEEQEVSLSPPLAKIPRVAHNNNNNNNDDMYKEDGDREVSEEQQHNNEEKEEDAIVVDLCADEELSCTTAVNNNNNNESLLLENDYNT